MTMDATVDFCAFLATECKHINQNNKAKVKTDLFPQISCLMMCEMLEYKECVGCISVNFLTGKNLPHGCANRSVLEMEPKCPTKSDA